METHLSAVEHHRAVVAVLTVVTGRLPGEHLVGLAETTGPVLVFVIAMTIVAELASVAGVFSIVAERLAVWGVPLCFSSRGKGQIPQEYSVGLGCQG